MLVVYLKKTPGVPSRFLRFAIPAQSLGLLRIYLLLLELFAVSVIYLLVQFSPRFAVSVFFDSQNKNMVYWFRTPFADFFQKFAESVTRTFPNLVN